jgi:hypothetical protein
MSCESYEQNDLLEKSRVIIAIRDFVNSNVLGGAVQGEALLSHLIQTLGSPTIRAPIFLDFRGIEVATSSFLRTSVFAFRAFCAEVYPGCAVVMANVGEVVLDELSHFLADRGDALVVCDLKKCAQTNARVVGVVEGQQAIALKLVIEAGTADAPTLGRRFDGGSGNRSTKWNNTLVALAKRGLVTEKADGRLKVYSPLIEGMTYGN